MSLRIAFFAFAFVAIGVIFDDLLVADVGWGVPTVCVLNWACLILGSRMLSHMIPYDLLGDHR